MKRSTSRCLALVSGVCAVCVGARATTSAARPQYGGTLRAEIEAAAISLDPAAPTADATQQAGRARISPLVFESMTTVDVDGLRPMLATAWQVEAGGSRWRFRLRSGVVLHDRKPLEAWQVAESIRAAEPSWKVSPDGDAIVVETAAPIADLPWTLGDERHAVVVRGSGGALIGTGPFRIDHVDSASVLLKAHELYWRARPFVDAVQIDLGRRPDTQLTDLESGRTDIIEVRAIDARRLTRRGLRIEASRPIDLAALVFEPHRAADAAIGWRRTFAATIDRDAIATVVLQGYAAPARAVLPDWESGYARAVSPAGGPRLSAAAVGALPVDQRTVALRLDAADSVAQAIAERIAVDARAGGFAVNVQAPVGLAPRGDARLVRVAVPATTADRAFAAAAARLATRGYPGITLPSDASLSATYRAEQALVDRVVVVPIVHRSEVYGIGERVGGSMNPVARPLGGWNLADVWLQGGKP